MSEQRVIEEKLLGIARSRPARIVGSLIVIASVWFMVDSAASSWTEIKSAIADVDFAPVVSAIGLVILAELLFVTMWRLLVSSMGDTLRWRAAFRAYSLSGIARFLPGGVVAHIGRAGIVMRYGVSPRVATVSTASETAFSAFAALALGVIGSISLLTGLGPTGRWVLILISATVVVFGAPRLVAWLSSSPSRILADRVAMLVSGYIGAWFLLGLSLMSLTAAFTTPGAMALSPLEFAGGIAIAWLAGLAALVVPGGLGVREAAIGTLLAGAVGPGRAVVIALTHRLAWSFVTLLLFLVAQVMTRAVNVATTSEKPSANEGPRE